METFFKIQITAGNILNLDSLETLCEDVGYSM